MPILAGKSECTGCSSCASACMRKCIEMVQDEFGFPYPEINTITCAECGCCEKACPIRSLAPLPKQKTVAIAAFSKNDDLRSESSSGGIFSELATEILERGGTVYGAAYDEQFRVRHISVEKEEELYKLRGAKYAQSDLNDVFRQIQVKLKTGATVLFSGTPCQVMGLKTFLNGDYERLICVDFVCHGVPSPTAWIKYVRHRCAEENDGKLPTKINLRSKDTGWSRYRYSTQFVYENQKITSCLSGEDEFMYLFVNDYINRLSCEDCKAKGFDRVSDITLGDFWGIWDVLPDMDDDKGVSLLLLHTEKGRRLVQNIDENIMYRTVDLDKASYMNQSIIASNESRTERSEVLYAICNGNFAVLERLKKNENPNLLKSMLTKGRRKIGNLFSKG